MGQDCITLKKKHPVLIGHVCSWCGAPILSVVTINASVSKYYSFSQGRAKKIVNETMENVIREEIERINDCRNSLISLLVNPCKDGKRSFEGCTYSSWIDDIQERCPNCLRLELWQTLDTDKTKFPTIEKANFPVIFFCEKDGISWVERILKEKTVPIGFENKSEEKDLKERTIQTYLKIKGLKREREDIPQLQKRDEITRQIKYLSELRDRLGLLDIKGKATAKKALKELNEEHNKLDIIIKDQQIKIDRRLLDYRLELQRLQAYAYGYTGKIVEKQHGTAIAYLLELKGILKKDIEEYLKK